LDSCQVATLLHLYIFWAHQSSLFESDFSWFHNVTLILTMCCIGAFPLKAPGSSTCLDRYLAGLAGKKVHKKGSTWL
jgi:hypothetical protein